MATEIHCQDMGADCDFVARGETIEEALLAGAEHGKAVHGIEEITTEMEERAQQVARSV